MARPGQRGWRGANHTIPSIRLLAELGRELSHPDPMSDDQALAETDVHLPRN